MARSGGRVFGNNENKASSDAVGSADNVDFGEPAPEKVRQSGTPAGRWVRRTFLRNWP